MAADPYPLLIDECVPKPIIKALNEAGYDATRTPRAGSPESPSDYAIVDLAAKEGRVIVTFDASTMRDAMDRWTTTGRQHPGMIIAAEDTDIGRLLRNLKHTLETTTAHTLRQAPHVWLQKPRAPAGGAD